MLSFCPLLRENIFRVGRFGMPSAALWASSEEKLFLFWIPKSLRTFRNPFFTERGRDRKRQLQDLFLHFGKSVMLVVDAVFRCDPPVKRPIGKIRRFSRLANINSLSAKNAQQRRRPPPAAETGRSCWGSGQQDASAAQGTRWMLGAATRKQRRAF